MRKFELYNNDNEVINLNDLRHFLQKPSGLGLERKVNYEQIGDMFKIVSDSSKQKVVEGEIFFKDYFEYSNFIQFCEKKPLKLEYDNNDEDFIPYDKFYIDVTLTSIKKTERSVGGYYCKARFTALGMWYRPIKAQELDPGESSNPKIYPYMYPYTYTKPSNEFQIAVESMYESNPVEITIYGPVTNPRWRHFYKDKEISSGRVNIAVPKDSRIVINNMNIPYSIKILKNNSDEELDVYQNSDFSTQRFMFLRPGFNKITLETDEGEDIKCSIAGREYFDSI